MLAAAVLPRANSQHGHRAEEQQSREQRVSHKATGDTQKSKRGSLKGLYAKYRLQTSRKRNACDKKGMERKLKKKEIQKRV